jgi:hypothetical protein
MALPDLCTQSLPVRKKSNDFRSMVGLKLWRERAWG